MELAAVQSPTVERFCRQYLQVEQSLDYPDGAELRQNDVQELLYERLFAAEALPPGPPPTYTLRVLKTLVDRIENSIDDWDTYGISDNIMMCLAEHASSGASTLDDPSSATKTHGVTYCLSALEGSGGQVPQITLAENRATIAAAGTTGIRTWEAALHLGAYLCNNRHLIQEKHIVELGAGTAYVSILCARHLGSAHCIASDGSTDVVQNMAANLQLNDLDGSKVTPQELTWGGDSDHLDMPKADVVLGADITFDQRDMPDLLQTIRNFVAVNHQAVVLIAATERNRTTFEAFLELASTDFRVEEVDFAMAKREKQLGPYYSDTVPIRICRLWPGR